MRMHLVQQPIPLQQDPNGIALTSKNLMMEINAAGKTPSGAETAAAMQHTGLVKAANSFEAQLMQELMKPLNAKDPMFSDSSNGGQDDDGESGGVMASYGNEALAQALAAGGGLGIGRMVVKQVESQASRNVKTPTKVSEKNSIHD